MNIAIVGAMGVGKTTIANEISRRLGYKILPEVAREMAKAGYKLDEGIDVTTEYEMIKWQMELELALGPWIADRCLIDTLAYCMVLFEKDIPLIKVAKRELDRANYDIIFYIPPEFPIENDGVRSTDVNFQKRIDEAIRKVLKGREFFIIKGSVERRAQKIINIINQKKP